MSEEQKTPPVDPPDEVLSDEDLAKARIMAAEIAGSLGVRRGGTRRDRADSGPSEPEVSPDNFAARMRMKADREGAAHTTTETGKDTDAEAIKTKKEQLDQLGTIARSIAELMGQEAEKERLAQIRDGVERENPYQPETTIEHTWYDRRPKKLPKINRFDTVPRVTGGNSTVCAEGWLLARAASVMDKQPIIQEVVLGADGQLYAYATDDKRYIEAVLNKPLSRRQIRDTGQDLARPWHTQVSSLPMPSGTQYNENTDPTVRNFYRVTGDNYPLPGIGNSGHIFAEPDAIQRGLEDLVLEKGLRLPEAQ